MAGIVDVPIGSPLAAKAYGVAVFSQVHSKPGFMNLLSEGAPDLGAAAKKMKGQTSPGAPIVKVTDLSSKPGTTVTVDLFNMLTGKPVMGDKRLEGNGMTTSSSTQEIEINRSRGMADNGGKVKQKRTVHNLRAVVQAGLTGWAQRLEDQRCLVHLAGARGQQATQDWVVPFDTDADYSEIMVNSVKAPTHNRKYYAMYTGTGVTPPSDITGMTANGYLSLSELDAIGSLLKESPVPLQQITMKDDPYSWDMPLYCMFVTERQWALMKAIAGSRWNGAVTDAVKRFDGAKRHPLFMGDSIMWNGIVVKPMNRYAIRFAPNTSMQETSAAGVESAKTTPNLTNGFIDRAIIVGAQALIKAYGNEGTQDFFYNWNEELVDHKSAVEVSLAMMEGTAKTRFTVNGALTDHGVAVIDSYAPPVGSSQFNTAVANSVGKY